VASSNFRTHYHANMLQLIKDLEDPIEVNKQLEKMSVFCECFCIPVCIGHFFQGLPHWWSSCG